MKVCSECESENVEYSIPAWFNANTHEHIGNDDEADVMYTFCQDCDESRAGNWLKEVASTVRCGNCKTHAGADDVGTTCRDCGRGIIEEVKL